MGHASRISGVKAKRLVTPLMINTPVVSDATTKQNINLNKRYCFLTPSVISSAWIPFDKTNRVMK